MRSYFSLENVAWNAAWFGAMPELLLCSLDVRDKLCERDARRGAF
jgi:hypothetical protein